VAARLASAGRPRFDIADVVRQHRAALEASVHLTLAQRRVLSAIELCRTAALGGHVDVCRTCGYEHPSYNSCRNRHCPKCQALAQERWIGARSERLLPVRHFHVVFTLPSQLRGLVKYRPRELFDALFAAASATLLELGDTRLGARLGVTMVLHTWTRELRFHPHVHAIVTAGGAVHRDPPRWIASSNKYLFPVHVMSALLRGKMMAALRSLHARGTFDEFAGFADPQGFDRLMALLARTRWIVYAKKPFRRPLHVLRYLGRYTHRVAISSSRLVAVTDDTVTWRTKDGKTATTTPVEFLRRFVEHVLPDGLHKIRHYGLYSGAHAETLAAVHAAIEPSAPVADTARVDAPWPTLLERLTGRDIRLCPACRTALDRIGVAPTARAPPCRVAV
jgi:hypothetical protein